MKTDVVSAVYRIREQPEILVGLDMDWRVRELILMCLLAALCGGAAWALGLDFFPAIFAAAAAIAGIEAIRRSL